MMMMKALKAVKKDLTSYSSCLEYAAAGVIGLEFYSEN